MIRRLDERFERDAPPGLVGDLWAATDLLLGLRYDKDVVQQLLRGVRGMRESSTYQAILEEGAVRGEIRDARWMVLELGTAKFGAPDAATAATLQRVDNLDVLRRLALNVLQTSTWQELLATIAER